MSLRPAHDKSIKFLQWFHPEGPWNVVAIATSQGKIEADTFLPGNEDAVRAFLRDHGEMNIYFTVNPIRAKIKKKPDRKDIKELAWLHVDVDPRPRENVEQEQERILKVLEAFDPEPSCVTFSGGGYQAFWRLREPFAVDGKEAAYDEAKRWNQQLEVLLDADSCHNIDRVMRLPGTINWPGAKKLEKGRQPALSRVVKKSDLVYDLSQFQKAPKIQQKGVTQKARAKVSGNVKRLESLDDLKVGSMCKVVIAQGHDPDDPARFDSRSEALWYVVCEMVREGIDDDTIFSVLTDPEWSVSAHVLDQSRPEDYALRQIDRAHEEAISPNLREMNDQYAVVQVGSKGRILREDDDDGTVHFMRKDDLKLMLANRFVTYDVKDKTITIPLLDWWLQNKNRRTYNRVEFAPGGASESTYNLWKGFAIEAIPGDVAPFLEHLRDNICQGNPEWYDYLVGWMAHTVQHPDQPGHTAVVLRGKPGTGKGTFANHFGRLFGAHYLPVSNSERILGRFNAHLATCVLLFADEAFWAGNPKQKGILKALITEESLVTEKKGLDIEAGRNYVHLIMASNEDWVVPLEGLDRRFFVLDVGLGRLQDHEYFCDLSNFMENGGHEALLHYLLSYDISAFNVRIIPENGARSEQRRHTLAGPDEWWFRKLEDGRLTPEDDTWPSQAWVEALLDDCREYLHLYDKSCRMNPTKFGLFMRSALGGSRRYQSSGEHSIPMANGDVKVVTRPYYYKLPSLDRCREFWEKSHGKTDWPVIEQEDADIVDAIRPEDEKF